MKIGRNVLFNLIGFICPVLVLFLSYPPLLRALGVERFGVLTLAMSLAAGLSFLDLGLSAASIRFVVSDLHRGDKDSAAKVITTTLGFFTLLGVFISLAFFLLSPWLAGQVKMQASQVDEAVLVFRLTALQIACSLFLGTLSGLFKAFDRFDLAAMVVTFLSILVYALPAFQVAILGHSLPLAIGSTIMTLFALSLVCLMLLARATADHGITLRHSRPTIHTFRRIFNFGAKLTLHALIGIFFSQGQRILVGFLFGPAPLAAYQLSITLAAKVHAAISAAAEVALPIASSAQIDVIRKNYLKGLLALSTISLVALGTIALAGHWILGLWLGDGMPPLAPDLLPPLCLAFFFVALSALPYHILNGLGYPGVNVAFGVLNIVVYGLVLLVIELVGQRNVITFTLAYAISNAVCGFSYQWYCYRLIKNLPVQAPSPHIS